MVSPSAANFTRFDDGVLANQVKLGDHGGFELAPNSEPGRYDIDTSAPVVQGLGETYSLAGYGVVREPIVVAQTEGLSGLPLGTSLNSLPIKFPGTGYRVPNELSPIRSILQSCVDIEQQLFRRTDDLYAYISVQRNVVEQGNKQRSSAVHCDDIQGPRIQPKVMTAHGYVMVDAAPTVFYPGAIDLTDLDEDKHDIAAAISQRVDRTNRVTFPVGALVLIDGYCVHEAGVLERTMPRGFFRMLFAVRQLDRTGNSYNRLFDEEYQTEGWEFQPRPTPANLVTPPPPSS